MLRMRDAQFYFMFLRIGRRGRHDIGQSSIAFNQLDISKIHLRRFYRQFNISSYNNDIVITGKIGLDGNDCRQLCRYKNLKGNVFFSPSLVVTVTSTSPFSCIRLLTVNVTS